MMIKDMLFFKFGSKDGMQAMLKIGPWLIQNVSLILKQWTPDPNIMKKDVSNIPVWVKFHDVPMTVSTDDGLSAIATKLAMVELKVDVELRDTIVIVVPKFSGEGFILSTIRVEYGWAPLRCSGCKVFGNVIDESPKKISSDISKNSKMSCQRARGPLVGLKPESTFVYRPVSTKKATKAKGNLKVQKDNKATTPTLNTFDALTRINDLERQMLDGKLVFVDDHGKPLEMEVTDKASVSKPNTSMGDQLVEYDEDDVKLPHDGTSSGGV
nr:hypothetical protein [Tanacetum cinerariifolium]